MKPVLFVIDMQYNFLSYITDRGERMKLVSNVIDTIDYCADKNISIAYFEYFGESRTNKDVKKAIEKAPRFRKITKYSDSAFSTRKTNSYLRELEADTTILSGINMSACLLDTAMHSVRNYETLTAENLTTDGRYAVDYAKEHDRHALKYLDSHCKLFETHEELIEYLDRRINYKLKLSAL